MSQQLQCDICKFVLTSLQSKPCSIAKFVSLLIVSAAIPAVVASSCRKMLGLPCKEASKQGRCGKDEFHAYHSTLLVQANMHATHLSLQLCPARDIGTLQAQALVLDLTTPDAPQPIAMHDL